MLEPPVETPAEVERQIAVLDREALRASGRFGTFTALAYLAFFPLLYWVGFREPWYLIAGPIVATVLVVTGTVVARRNAYWSGYIAIVGNVAMFALFAWMVNPIVIGPGRRSSSSRCSPRIATSYRRGCSSCSSCLAVPHRRVVGTEQLEVVTSSQYAGAISGLEYGGMQFVNNHDHGRQFQMALFTNGWGGCNNPTEAGSSQDDRNPTTSSELGGISTTANTISTASQPAYWEQLGESDPSCPVGYGVGTAAPATAGQPHDGSTTLADQNVTFAKEIVVNVAGDPQIFKVFEEIDLYESLTDMFMIAMAAYLEPQFTVIEDFTDNTLVPNTDATFSPLVYSTPDQNYAIALVSSADTGPRGGLHGVTYSPQLNWPNQPWDPENNTSAQNAVFSFHNAVPGSYTATEYFIVGSRADVLAKLQTYLAEMMAGAL
jgi:hypothetical protein